jgi:hypothetical protein
MKDTASETHIISEIEAQVSSILPEGLSHGDFPIADEQKNSLIEEKRVAEIRNNLQKTQREEQPTDESGSEYLSQNTKKEAFVQYRDAQRREEESGEIRVFPKLDYLQIQKQMFAEQYTRCYSLAREGKFVLLLLKAAVLTVAIVMSAVAYGLARLIGDHEDAYQNKKICFEAMALVAVIMAAVIDARIAHKPRITEKQPQKKRQKKNPLQRIQSFVHSVKQLRKDYSNSLGSLGSLATRKE